MNKLPYIIGICGLSGCLVASCGNDDEDEAPFPALITEFMDIHTDNDGLGRLLVTDKGCTYAASRPLQGLQPASVYRIVGGYVQTDRYDGPHQVVELRTADKVNMLRPTESPSAESAPVSVTSIWRGGSYLNFNLAPKTQGGEHKWGYRLDGIRETDTGHTYDITLTHQQSNDPYSYSITVYASLFLESFGGLQTGDSIACTVLTFDGKRTWRIAY